MDDIHTNEISFEWDQRKNRRNRTKHSVSFEEAATAFADERARVLTDPDHSSDEERFLLIGRSDELRLLVISHCYRKADEVIRIISARLATPTETRQYARWLS